MRRKTLVFTIADFGSVIARLLPKGITKKAEVKYKAGGALEDGVGIVQLELKQEIGEVHILAESANFEDTPTPPVAEAEIILTDMASMAVE